MFSRNAKRCVKNAIAWCACSEPVQWFAGRVHRDSTVFLMYHGVIRDDQDIDAWTLIPESRFREHMTSLKSSFDCVSIDKALERNRQGGRRPAVVVTFDDGYANNIEVALPILNELEIPATVYVTSRNVVERRLFWHDKILMAAHRSAVRRIDLGTIAEPLGEYSLDGDGERWYENVSAIWEDVKRVDPHAVDDVVDRIVSAFREAEGAEQFDIYDGNRVLAPLTGDQISRLADDPLITIGAHSHCHWLLDRIPLDEAARSIRESKDVLQDLADREIRHFSYPNGNFNSGIAGEVKNAGFVSAVTTRPGFYRGDTDPYEINRFGVGAWTTTRMLKARLTGVFDAIGSSGI